MVLRHPLLWDLAISEDLVHGINVFVVINLIAGSASDGEYVELRTRQAGFELLAGFKCSSVAREVGTRVKVTVRCWIDYY